MSLTASHEVDSKLLAWTVLAKRDVNVLDVLKLTAPERGEHVAGRDPSLSGGAAVGDPVNQHAGRLVYTELAGDLSGELRGLDPDEGMLDPSLLEQLIGHADRGGRGNGKADGHRSLLRRDVGIGYPDHLALRIDDGAT